MTRLIHQAWLTALPTVAVLDALTRADGEGRFVGGCVRDALIGRPVSDIDIATPLRPEIIVSAVEAAGLKAVPTGIEHGTITVVSSGRPYEVTTLRRDVSTDGRRATVAFSEDWNADAARRDFRLNALYADRTGVVFDPTGEGISDALAGRIVFVGDAERRIREDYLRILRFFRFRAWFGRDEPDATAVEACAHLKDGVHQLSAERVSSELLKLLSAPDPRPALDLMIETGVLSEVLPCAERTPLFRSMVEIDSDPLMRLSALLPADPNVVRAAAEALRLSNVHKARLLATLPDQPAVDVGMDDTVARVALYRLGRQTFRDRLVRAWAAGPVAEERARRLLALADAWQRPAFPITGADLKAAGMRPGPRMGRLLEDLENWWIAEDFPEAGLEDRLAALLAERGAE
ncbi:CCA tRNA nucleotidyltransferase [Brevundimonas aveniformis]|uniref:CCA tRNA nucleotidyltransferase n=1 Tax=Brevundimonas aveniformis TaxID=370977 RepID=UPI00049122DD|nr:CCA tRNA nucleotidyltransferase [Brevundimonas aveniformis]